MNIMKKIKVKVIPRAGKQEITYAGPDQYRIKLKSAPIKGRANQELISLLAHHFKVGKSSIEIVKGLYSRNKVVVIK